MSFLASTALIAAMCADPIEPIHTIETTHQIAHLGDETSVSSRLYYPAPSPPKRHFLQLEDFLESPSENPIQSNFYKTHFKNECAYVEAEAAYQEFAPMRISPDVIFMHLAEDELRQSITTDSFCAGFSRFLSIRAFECDGELCERAMMLQTFMRLYPKTTTLAGRSTSARASAGATIGNAITKNMFLAFPLVLKHGTEKCFEELVNLPKDNHVLLISGTLDNRAPPGALDEVRRIMGCSTWLIRVLDADHNLSVDSNDLSKHIRMLDMIGQIAALWHIDSSGISTNEETISRSNEEVLPDSESASSSIHTATQVTEVIKMARGRRTNLTELTIWWDQETNSPVFTDWMSTPAPLPRSSTTSLSEGTSGSPPGTSLQMLGDPQDTSPLPLVKNSSGSSSRSSIQSTLLPDHWGYPISRKRELDSLESISVASPLPSPIQNPSERHSSETHRVVESTAHLLDQDPGFLPLDTTNDDHVDMRNGAATPGQETSPESPHVHVLKKWQLPDIDAQDRVFRVLVGRVEGREVPGSMDPFDDTLARNDLSPPRTPISLKNSTENDKPIAVLEGAKSINDPRSDEISLRAFQKEKQLRCYEAAGEVGVTTKEEMKEKLGDLMK